MGVGKHVANLDSEWYIILKICSKGNQSKEILKVLVCATLYAIGKERNDRRFRNKSMTCKQLSNIMKKFRLHLSKIIVDLKDSTKSRIVCDYSKIKPNWIRKEQKHCKWTRPKQDQIVLNSDVSVRDNGFGN